MKERSAWKNKATWARCKRKVRYRNVNVASRVAMQQSMKIFELLIAYECPDCGYFHIGHADKAQLAAHADTVKYLERMKRRKEREDRGELLESPRIATGFCAAEDCRKDIRGKTKMGVPLVYCSKACRKRSARHRANLRNFGTVHRPIFPVFLHMPLALPAPPVRLLLPAPKETTYA